jgi:hypothetical protein
MKLLTMLMCSSVFPALSYGSFKVSYLQLRFLINFELIFEQVEKHGSSFSFLLADIQFSQQHLFNILFFPLYDLCIFVKKLGGSSCVDLYMGFLFFPIGICVCLCVCVCVCVCVNTMLSLLL